MKKKQKIIYRGLTFSYAYRSDILRKAKRELNCSNLEYFIIDRHENLLKVLFYCIEWHGYNIDLLEFLNDYYNGLIIISRHDQYNLFSIKKSLFNAIKKFRVDW